MMHTRPHASPRPDRTNERTTADDRRPTARAMAARERRRHRDDERTDDKARDGWAHARRGAGTTRCETGGTREGGRIEDRGRRARE